MRKHLSFKRKRNKGYTLAEMLIVIAITVVLLGISTLAIIGFKENLKMSELDDYAKIIYLEAQDQLGIVEVEGALDAYHTVVRSTYTDPSTGANNRLLKELYSPGYVQDYPIDPSDTDAEKEPALKMWENMFYLTKGDDLATKMISRTSDIFLNGGYYIIEFNPKTGDVYGVFYWESDTPLAYSDIQNLSSRERSDRKAKKIGYYGGALAGDLDEQKTLGEKVTLVNGEELYLKISFDKTTGLVTPYSNLQFKVSVTGENSAGVSKTITFDNADLTVLRNNVFDLGIDTIDFYMLLDSMYDGHRFNDIVNAGRSEAESIAPGANITVKVETTYTDTNGSVIKNANSVQGNSLFANATNEDQIGITALRHMLNLNSTIYNADSFADRDSIQYITDVDFTEEAYSWAIEGVSNEVYKGYGAAARPLTSITPIVNDALFKEGSTGNREVTGKNASSKYVLRNFIVEQAAGKNANAGIFSEIHNVDFSNIYVEDIMVNAADCDNVGALIGYMENGSVTECGVYLTTVGEVGGVETEYCMMADTVGTCHDNEMAHRYDTYRIKGKNNVGGLVGKAESTSDVKIDKAFASIKATGANEYVGGLIGYAHIPSGTGTFTIEHSYASGDATGQHFVGGLAGAIVSEGTNRVAVTDNYATGNVFGIQKFGGFIGKTQKADYTDCVSYGEVCKYVASGTPVELDVADMVGGFVHDSAETNIDSTYKKKIVDGVEQATCIFMGQNGYNRSHALEDPTDVANKDYSELLSENAATSVQIAHPYDVELYMLAFPFEKLQDQRIHYGNWPKKFIIDTSLVYYEKYADGSYGYYCVTTASGIDNIWLLDTLKEETCIEDGYGLLTKYNLESISYDLYIGNQGQDGNASVPSLSGVNVPIVDRGLVEGSIYSDESFVYLNQQGNLKFEEIESYDAEEGKEGTKTGAVFEVNGLYLYQLPYDLQCTDRRGVSYFYDRIVLSANAKGGTNRKVIDELAYLYCPHFAKTAYNPNVSSQPIDLEQTNPVPNPTNVFIRSARQLNALGRFPYYWNARGGLANGESLQYIQETDINFSTYVKNYGGCEFDLQAFDKEYSNHPIGVPDYEYTDAQFRNTYDGQSNKIIDYCVNTTDVQFTGLFGEIRDATLKNIVMLVSSNPGENGGKIISGFRTTSKNGITKEMRAGVGALVGLAFENKPTQVSSNRIENCVVAGYTVQYELVKGNEANDLDPLGVAVGGLVGLSMSDISNCSVTNDVIINLKKDYSNTYPKNGNGDGVVYLGGAFGSHGYGEVKDCYSGGTIDVFSNGYRLPSLRVGGFCPGWLDTFPLYKSNTPYFATKKVVYENIYSYTEVSDRIHDEAESLYYIPLVSKIVEIFDKANTRSWIAEAIRNDGSVFTNNYYLEEVSLNHMENVEDTVVAYYQNVATGCSYDELVAMATNKADRTYLNGDLDGDGNLIPYERDYPYKEVIYDVNEDGTNGDYVHYGEWFEPFLPDNVVAYYEKYADGSYGYYCMTADKYGNDVWVLNTLKNEACVEDGYGLMTKYQLDSLEYKNVNKSTNYTTDTFNLVKTQGLLCFRGYQNYNEKIAQGENSLKESTCASSLYVNLYKFPSNLQDIYRDKGAASYFEKFRFRGKVGSTTVFTDVECLYNPHFAKTALNIPSSRYNSLKKPTNIYVRSARQLNALGRYDYYWCLKGGEDGKQQINFIQEIDINFSIYTKNYQGRTIDLQEFGTTYSNEPIGQADNNFQNNYDGRGNEIVDYCVKGGVDGRHIGLFGEIQKSTIKNIVMVVSSNPTNTNAGLMIGSFRKDGEAVNVKTHCSALGVLVGQAYESAPYKEITNSIENCVASGYTIRYELANTTTQEPLAIAMGGLVGLSASHISNCEATNNVEMKLAKSYNHTGASNNYGGVLYMGGFVGSQKFADISNCYSGGTINVVTNNFTVPNLRVGGFCPGWLDTRYSDTSDNGKIKNYVDYLAEINAGNIVQDVSYTNVYSYTKVSDSIWDANPAAYYVPLVSTMVEYITWTMNPGSENGTVTWETMTSIPSGHYSFSNNIYIEEVTAAHLARTDAAIKTYYENASGKNFTAMRKSLLSLRSYQIENRQYVTVTDKTTNTHKVPAVDANGNLIISEEAYPYPAVVQKVDTVMDGDIEKSTTTGEYVHFGDWPEPLENTLVYYELYEDNTYGYHGVMFDLETSKTWVLNTLLDKTCIEDGYALLSQFKLDSINFDVYPSNVQDVITTGGTAEVFDVEVDLSFDEYASYDQARGEIVGEPQNTLDISKLNYMYKVPYNNGQAKNINNAFYDRVVIDGVAGEKEVITAFYSMYNPHFAKAAINVLKDDTCRPTNVYVRSARQLNALGRNRCYWQLKGGSTGAEDITFIQETDINFSTYTKTYMGQEFDLQDFTKSYRNRPIGAEDTMFTNNYNGQGNLIIDYCVDGGIDIQYVGLFGKIANATIENIVMLVSSNPNGKDAGKITGSFQAPQDNWSCRAGVGALIGFAYDSNAISGPTNIIRNCTASGYVVQYELQESLVKGYDPVGIAVGGLVGFSHNDISNSSATNDVLMILHRDYNKTFISRDGYSGVVNLGGFAGSLMYGQVSDCYSGGQIDVDNKDMYSIRYLNIGGFCPGWLDILIRKGASLYNFCNASSAYSDEQKVSYKNIYSYTKVSDTVWEIPAQKDANGAVTKKFTNYVPLVSNMAWRLKDLNGVQEWVMMRLPQDTHITFEGNVYIEEVTAAHLARTPESVKAYYMNADGNFTATRKSLYGLEHYVSADRNDVEKNNTFINGDWDEDGKLIPYSKDYPYPAVVYQVDENGNKKYAHYGEWPKPFESVFVYYEKYGANDYGYYGVISEGEGKTAYVLNTLKDRTCTEDGYALLTQFDLESLSYEIQDDIVSEVKIEGANIITKVVTPTVMASNTITADYIERSGELMFDVYQSYNAVLGKVVGDKAKDGIDISNLSYMYKLPYHDAELKNRTGAESFYYDLTLNAVADGEEVITSFHSLYNPHFAKSAINETGSDPTNIYVRSAKQLNALGRNPYYWNEKGGLANGEKVTFVQETDINFSTYVKAYDGEVFNLQLFEEPYANKPIGIGGGKQFKNTYDGCGNAIIDYSVDGKKENRYTGLFGEIQNATLKNIVMVVSTKKESEDAGTITTNFRPKDTDGTASVGLGALVGSAYHTGNIIENCAVSGYKVVYKLSGDTDYDPVSVAVGGLAGFSMSPITNCTATNDVAIQLGKDYTGVNTNVESTGKGTTYLGGIVGSQLYSPVTNCYSGGTIDVINNGYSIPRLRVGGICPGWLDIGIELTYDYNQYKTDTNTERIVKYEKLYSYTKVSDSIWNAKSESVIFVPVASRLVDYLAYANMNTASESKIKFDKNSNIYVEEVTTVHLGEATAESKVYYMDAAGNFTAKKTNYAGLANYAKNPLLANTATNTYVNGDWDENGELESSGAAYPYPAVIYEVDEDGNKTYAHYGKWPTIIDTTFVYYEKYGNEKDGYSYGFYGVMSVPGSDKTWILNTLEDKECVEDGYALLSEFEMNEVNYDLYVGNKGTKKSSKLTFSDNDRLNVSEISKEDLEDLAFTAYESYNAVVGVAEGEIESFNVNNLAYMYKLPFDLQFTTRASGHTFYDRIVFNAKVNGKQVIEGFTGLYNPLFAKTAIASYGETYQNPTNIYIRSARQLNALGRSSYFWSWNGYLYGASKVTFIQESDINFSTYAGENKKYLGYDFDLQSFDLKISGKDYSNHAIGESYGTPFTNIYDGRSNQIIDYCVDGGDDTHFTGLFGEIKNATLKNIVMTVSSDKKGNAGLITSSYRTHHYSKDNEESIITIRENRAGVGALLGMANTDSGYNTIKNCVAAGYTVKYVLKDRSDELRPLHTSLNQARGDIIEPLGIAIGGLIGYSPDSISNCAAVNDVVIELHKDYQNTYDNYINRAGNNKSNYGTGGVVYMGGFVGSHYYGKIDNCYSGGTIDVIDNGYSIPKLRVGGFCPGWMDTPMKGDYYVNCSVEYANIYSYTKVSDNIWNVLGKKDWNSTENVFEDTDEKADTYYVPLVSRLVDYFKYDVRNKEYWLHDQSVLEKNATFTNNSYLLELSATHMKHVLNDSSDMPDKFYLDANGKDVTATQITADELAANTNVHVAKTYLNADTEASTAYPYQAVITDVKTEKFVHYGDWYDGSIEEGLVEKYPTYYEEYEDGYGFWYVKDDGTVVSTLTAEVSKPIESTGYGYLTIHPELATEDTNKVNVDVEVNAEVGNITYYLQKVAPGDVENWFTDKDTSKVCRSFNMTYRKVTKGTQLGSGSIIKTLPLYMNPKYGAALSPVEVENLELGTTEKYPMLGTTEKYPFQIRTKEQFQNIGGLNTYYKQTHDVDLTGGHSDVTIGSGSYYDGSFEDGCIIRNASDAVFNVNNGMITNVRVVSFKSANVLNEAVAGFVNTNNGTIKHCAIAPMSEDDEVLIQGTVAYGFAATNNGEISKAYVVGRIIGTDSAAGFVGTNTGKISYCTVGNPNAAVDTVVEGRMAFGFVHLNYDATPYENDGSPTIRHCVATARVKAATDSNTAYNGNVVDGVASGFVGENTGETELCVVYLENDGEAPLIEGTYAAGFVIRNSDSGFGTIVNCHVLGMENAGDMPTIKARENAVGFAGKNYGNITESYVRALTSYDDLVIQGKDAYGFIYMSNASAAGNKIQNCFAVGTVKADVNAAGFVGSNNAAGVISKCYANTNVSTSLTNKEAKASGFAHWSGGVALYGKEEEIQETQIQENWIENCYAAGSVSGYTTSGFLYAGFAKNCYTIVEHADATEKCGWIDNELNADVYPTKHAIQLDPANNNSWGYDEESDFNADIPLDVYAKTLATLDAKANNTAAFPFNEELGTEYPYETYGLTHYGDWYGGGVKVKRASKYPVYYETYADGSYGFWYVDEYGDTGKNLTKDTAKVITGTGYGYLTSSQDEANVDNATIKLGVRTYYLQTVQQPSQMYDGGNADTSNPRYVHFKLDYYSATTGKLISEDVSVYMNADYGAGLSGSSDFGTESNPFQVRTKEQFKNIANNAVEKYIKQTHDIDLSGGHKVNVNVGTTYYGSSEDGCVIKNATDTPFAQNNGTIEMTKVTSFNSSGSSKDVVAGFVIKNKGTIRNCSVQAKNENDVIIEANKAFGFVEQNNADATIENCSVVAYIKGTEETAGFVDINYGSVKNCTVGNKEQNIVTVIEARDAYGFAEKNYATIDSCTTFVKARATNQAAGFIEENKGDINASDKYDITNNTGIIINSTVYLSDSSETDPALYSEIVACGFSVENVGTIENCKVLNVGRGSIIGKDDAYGFVRYNGMKKEISEDVFTEIQEGLIINCQVGEIEDSENMIINAGKAYGFAKENNPTSHLYTSYVVGQITTDGKTYMSSSNSDAAYGFVGTNWGKVENCQVGYDKDTNDSVNVLMRGTRAYGFIRDNRDTIKGSSVVGTGKTSIISTATPISKGQTDNNDMDRGMAIGFVSENFGAIENSYVRAMNGYEDIVIQGEQAFGFMHRNRGSSPKVTKCFAVATVKADLYAAGFAKTNNVSGGITNCYANANVSVSTTKSGAIACGFVQDSGDRNGYWIKNCYAVGTVKGYTVCGFADSADVSDCYTIVSLEDWKFMDTFKRAGTHDTTNTTTYFYWGYDVAKNFNMKAKNAANASSNPYGKTLAALDALAEDDKEGFAFNEYLKGQKYPYKSYGLTHYGDWPVPSYFNQAVKGDDFLRAGLYYCEEYKFPGSDAITYGIYAVGDYHNKTTGVRSIGTTVNTLMQGTPEELEKVVTKRYYGMYYHVDMNNGVYCHTDDKWTPSWYYSFNGAAQSQFKSLTTTLIPDKFTNYRFCRVTEAVGPTGALANSATATIFYKTNTDGKHTDTNYDDLFDQQGDKNGVTSDAEKAKGITLTITQEDVEAARKSGTLGR